MRPRHRSVAQANRTDGDRVDSQEVDGQPDPDDVDDGIDGPDLVEVHLVDRHPMGFGLDLAEPPEGAPSAVSHLLGQWCRGDQSVDRAPSATVFACTGRDLDAGGAEAAA